MLFVSAAATSTTTAAKREPECWLIFILYILHLNSAMICLFVNMSNIFSVMKVEHISGDKELKWSSILAIFPIASFIASLLAYKSIIKIKNRTSK